MKKIAHKLLLCFLLAVLVVPVYASTVFEPLVNDNFEDRLINSPVLALAGIILVIAIARVYRLVRK